jgi:hypothetical protein
LGPAPDKPYFDKSRIKGSAELHFSLKDVAVFISCLVIQPQPNCEVKSMPKNFDPSLRVEPRSSYSVVGCSSSELAGPI